MLLEVLAVFIFHMRTNTEHILVLLLFIHRGTKYYINILVLLLHEGIIFLSIWARILFLIEEVPRTRIHKAGQLPVVLLDLSSQMHCSQELIYLLPIQTVQE